MENQERMLLDGCGSAEEHVPVFSSSLPEKYEQARTMASLHQTFFATTEYMFLVLFLLL